MIMFNCNWLVVSTHLKHISQIGSFPKIGVKITNIWKHHPGKDCHQETKRRRHRMGEGQTSRATIACLSRNIGWRVNSEEWLTFSPLWKNQALLVFFVFPNSFCGLISLGWRVQFSNCYLTNKSYNSFIICFVKRYAVVEYFRKRMTGPDRKAPWSRFQLLRELYTVYIWNVQIIQSSQGCPGCFILESQHFVHHIGTFRPKPKDMWFGTAKSVSIPISTALTKTKPRQEGLWVSEREEIRRLPVDIQ